MRTFVPIWLNLNCSYTTCDGENILPTVKVDYIRIKAPRNINSQHFIRDDYRHKRFLTDNKLGLILHPTIGLTLEDFYLVEYYSKPYERNHNGRLLHSEYWAVPLYNKCFLSRPEQLGSCEPKGGCPKCGCDKKCGCQKPMGKSDCKELCPPKFCYETYEAEFDTMLPAINLGMQSQIMVIEEVIINDVPTTNWTFANNVLNLLIEDSLPRGLTPIKIKYIKPLELCDLYVIREKCFDNYCFSPSCCY